jgi:hypothetical protein
MTVPIAMDIVVPPGRTLPEGVEGALFDLGVLPQVRSYKHVDDLTQTVILVVALKPFWDAFATRVGEQLGDRLSEALIRVFKRVPDPKYLADAETGTAVRLDEEFLTSMRALPALQRINLADPPGTRLRWHEARGCWSVEDDEPTER